MAAASINRALLRSALVATRTPVAIATTTTTATPTARLLSTTRIRSLAAPQHNTNSQQSNTPIYPDYSKGPSALDKAGELFFFTEILRGALTFNSLLLLLPAADH